MTGARRVRIKKTMGAIYVATQCVFLVAFYLELAGMRIAEWTQPGLVALALLFGYTSVLYGRARAFNPGPIQRRTLYAADRALRATIFYVIATTLIAIIHLLLTHFGYDPEPRSVIPSQRVVPMLLFFPVVLLAVIVIANVFDSLRAISFRFLVLVRARQFSRYLKL